MIRLATVNDIGKFHQLLIDYDKSDVNSYGVDFDIDTALVFIKQMIDMKNAFLMLEDDRAIGCFVGMLTKCFFSKQQFFQEIFFYINEENRYCSRDFIRYIEDQLKDSQVDHLVIGNMYANNGEAMGRYYEILGFKRLETHYIKQIKG